MVYFLYTNYTPNSAETNRALSYLKSLDKAGKKLEVIFFLPDKYGSKISFRFTNIKVTYLWERFNIKHRILKYIPYIINILLFRLRLKRGDAVYIYGMNDVKRFFVGINGVKSFYECTEHPEVSLMPDKLRRCSLNEHIKTCKRLNGLFVISTALKDYYIKKGVASDRIHIINMTVDTSRFDGLLKNKNKEKYIAYCGKVSNNKDGVDQLIHAFSIVHKIIPDIKLYIVGAIPANLSNEHNIKLIQDLNLSEYIVLTGMLPADEIPQIMVDAEMLVLDRPDNLQAKFGFPTKLGEYLLSANPVVVTGVGDIPLFLQDKDSALISPPNNPQAFAEKIVWALQNPVGELNIEYLDELRNRIKEYDIGDMLILHDHVQNVPQVMSLYDAVCLPSLKEGFSNTISEAICLGKPLLVSDVSDNKVMVHNGENGYLFNPTDISDMVDKITTFYYLTTEQKEEMGRKSRKIAETLFQKDKFINSYVRLIEQ